MNTRTISIISIIMILVIIFLPDMKGVSNIDGSINFFLGGMSIISIILFYFSSFLINKILKRTILISSSLIYFFSIMVIWFN